MDKYIKKGAFGTCPVRVRMAVQLGSEQAVGKEVGKKDWGKSVTLFFLFILNLQGP